MRALLSIFVLLFFCACTAMHAKVDPAIDNTKYYGDYQSVVTKSARMRHKWNTIYIEEPVHTVNGWSGRVVFTHSGTMDDMYVYTIEPSGYVTFKYAGIDRDEIDRLKFKVNNSKKAPVSNTRNTRNTRRRR